MTVSRNNIDLLIVYDVTDRNSFYSVDMWLQTLRRLCKNDNVQIILVGNKCDMDDKRQVTKEGSLYAENNEVFFYEVSSLSNVDNVFMDLCEKICSVMKITQINHVINSLIQLTMFAPHLW